MASFCTGSAVLTDASSTGGVAAGSIGRGSGKAAPPRSRSATSTELAAALASFGAGSAMLTDASSTGGVAAGGIGRGSGKAASALSRSAASTGLAAALASFRTGSAMLTDASGTGGVAAGGIGRGSGKATPRLSISATATPPSPIAVASGASRCSAREVTDVARLSSIGAPVFSMPSEPGPASLAAATQLARTTVPHNAPTTANRRGPITPSRLVQGSA